MVSSFKVEVTSKEIIKPSSPTPPHPSIIQLSFLDQFAPSIYIPLIFFYQNEQGDEPTGNSEKPMLLKKSLSNILVHFYPLAGRVKDNTLIDCNDEGVEFHEAKVSSNLLEVVENPNLEDLRGLLPFEPIARDKNIVLGVQVNHFSCGGLAISVCISHKIADGKAFVDFVNTWATMARGVEGDDHVLVSPKFDGAFYFPPTDLSETFKSNARLPKENIVTRRFIFDKKRLDALKQQAIHNIDGIPPKNAPTRVEVVSSFLWKHVMEATRRVNPCFDKISTVVHAVNLRKRRTPSIQEDSFGNFYWFTVATSSLGESTELPSLVSRIKEAIRKINGSFIKTLEEDNTEFFSKIRKANVGIEDTCRFSSWCGFPLYEVNFGWGKPTWVCTTKLPFKNLVILLNTKCGEGIEAWVNMLEDEIAMVEKDLGPLHLNHDS